MFTKRDLPLLLSLAKYDLLTRSQLQHHHADSFTGKQADRSLRARLAELTQLKFIHRTNMQVVNPSVNAGSGAPVYYMGARGVELLLNEIGDEKFRLLNTTTPYFLFLYHFIEVSAFGIQLHEAARLADVTVNEWLNERALKNPKATAPHEKFRLYARIDEKTVAVPDAGFVLEKGDLKKVFLVEIDRDTTKNADRVAASKCRGIAALALNKLHLDFFPQATWPNFNVLRVAPTAHRRDRLRKAFASDDRPGAAL